MSSLHLNELFYFCVQILQYLFRGWLPAVEEYRMPRHGGLQMNLECKFLYRMCLYWDKELFNLLTLETIVELIEV